MCINDDCDGKKFSVFVQGVRHLGLDSVGGSMIRQIWNAGFRNPLDLLNPTKFTRERLYANSELKPGRLVEKMYIELAKVTELKPVDIIIMLGFPGMGHTTGKQIGNMIAGVKYSFIGLQRNIVEGFEPGTPKREKYEAAVKELSQYIKILMPEKIADNAIPYECTGSPKAFGFTTKEEFASKAKSRGYYHTSLKEAKILFTDDMNSSSSKMGVARKRGIKILLYTELS